ncbi:MAG TPA: ribosome silencing factor [Acidimicrobiales bacterium]
MTPASLDRADVERLAAISARAADDKQAADVVILDVGDVLGICDLFVIASASNERQVRTVAEEAEHQVKQAGGPGPLRVEGLAEARWVLLDWGGFVMHVFHTEARKHYDLERLWRDVPRLEWAPEASHHAN